MRKLMFTVLVSNLCFIGLAQYDESLIAFYDFRGHANDLSGNENHGILYGTTPTVDRFGEPDGALYFDGIDDYVDLGSLGNVQYDSYTISMWVLTESLPGKNMALFSNYEDWMGDNHNMILLGLHASDGSNANLRGKTYFIQRDPDPNNGGNYEGGDYFISDHLWNDHHVDAFTNITVVRDALNSTQTLYVNGVISDHLSSLSQNAMTKDDQFLVGKLAIYDVHFEGVIDELRIYDRALSDVEVLALSDVNALGACMADKGVRFDEFDPADHGKRFGQELNVEYKGFEWGYSGPIKLDTWGSWTVVDSVSEVLGANDSHNWVKARASDEGKGAKITHPVGFVFQSVMLYTDDRPAFLQEVRVTYRTTSGFTSDGEVIPLLPNRWIQLSASDLGVEHLPLKSIWFNGPGVTEPNSGKFGLDNLRWHF